VSIVGIIGGARALELLGPLINDADPQVSEIARDYLNAYKWSVW
jgi:hypothetical protein